MTIGIVFGAFFASPIASRPRHNNHVDTHTNQFGCKLRESIEFFLLHIDAQ